MKMIFPERSLSMDGSGLEEIYDYPKDLEHCWVQVNFVSSADGAATASEYSNFLSNPADRNILALGRDLADVIVAGVTTAIGGEYQKIRVDPTRRERLGLSPQPPIAMITNRCSLSPGLPQIVDAPVPPIVITCRNAPSMAQRDLIAAGVDLVVAGEDAVDLHGALKALEERGMKRVNCEGGPTLFGSLINEDLVDALCLTLAPFIVGGSFGRISTHQLSAQLRPMSLDSVLEAEGSLFMKYGRHRRANPSPDVQHTEGMR